MEEYYKLIQEVKGIFSSFLRAEKKERDYWPFVLTDEASGKEETSFVEVTLSEEEEKQDAYVCALMEDNTELFYRFNMDKRNHGAFLLRKELGLLTCLVDLILSFSEEYRNDLLGEEDGRLISVFANCLANDISEPIGICGAYRIGTARLRKIATQWIGSYAYCYYNGLYNKDTMDKRYILYETWKLLTCYGYYLYKGMYDKEYTVQLIAEKWEACNDTRKYLGSPKKEPQPGEKVLSDFLPNELNSDEAQRLLAKAIEAGLMERGSNGYQWKKSKSLLAYFADRASESLGLGKAEYECGAATAWKPFEQMFGVEGLKTCKADWKKTGTFPRGKEDVDSIFE